MNFTSSSGIEWHTNGAFTLGCEAMFSKTDTAEKIDQIPFDPSLINRLEFWGNVAYRPKEGSHKANDCLVRIWLMSDDKEGFQIVNVILKTLGQVDNITIPWSLVNFPPPIGDNPYKIKVQANAAGAEYPSNVEIQLCGRWFKE